MKFPVIIGLGNPGNAYVGTRHNIGFMVLDRLASPQAAFRGEPKWQSQIARLNDGTWLVKPQSFMNLSGRPVRSILSFRKIPPQSMLVVYDDTSLPLGTLRFREKGSSGGHNGIRSIIEHCGTQEFPRLKIGIGGAKPGNMTGHVLGKFLTEELPILENTLASAREAIQLARSQGLAIAANHYHQRPSPPSNHHSDEPQIPRTDRP